MIFTKVISGGGSGLQVQGRVVEGYAGQPTLSATQWTASFTSTGSADPTHYSATVNWGDGSAPAPATISTSDASSCTYTATLLLDPCFVVSARHTYAFIGDWITTTTVTSITGEQRSDRGIAEIIASSGHPGTPSSAVGVITFHSGTDSRWWGCTAEALANVNVIMSVGHCTNSLPAGQPNFNFEFGPQHKGNCWPGTNTIDLASCETTYSNPNSGHPLGTDPVGYWTASSSDVYRDLIGFGGDGPSFIVTSGVSFGVNGSGITLVNSVNGLPVHFLSPRGLSWNEYGYPVYAATWNLTSCGPATEVSNPSSGNLYMTEGCTYNGLSPATDPSGSSGGPWINSNYLKNAVGIVTKTWCKPFDPADPGGCATQNQQGGVVLDNGSMHAFIQAVLASGSAR